MPSAKRTPGWELATLPTASILVSGLGSAELLVADLVSGLGSAERLVADLGSGLGFAEPLVADLVSGLGPLSC